MPIEILLYIIIALLLARHFQPRLRIAGVVPGPALQPWEQWEQARLKVQLNNVFGGQK
jgi:hypothetical protein